MRPGDRLVCAFVEPQAVGVQFKEWLLHVTIVPWFRLEDNADNIVAGLQKALTPIKPFEAKIIGETLKGPRKRPAHILEPAKFPEVEQRVRSYLHKKRAWLVDETTKKPRQFQPHVTFQGETHLPPGANVVCDCIYVIEQKGNYKRVAARIDLQN